MRWNSFKNLFRQAPRSSVRQLNTTTTTPATATATPAISTPAISTPATSTQATTDKMSSSEAFFQAIETRRTNYALKAESTISDEALKALVERAVKHSPTSFNMQEARAVLVTGKAHKEIWELVKTEHVKTLGTDEGQIQFWTNKFDTQYAAGYGTVLFFEDDAVIEGYIAKMPAYKEAFIAFSGHVTGMLQIVVWTALAAEGLGGSLQHYTLNPAINTAIVEKLSLPATWKGTALLPFGVPAAPPAEKTFSPIEDRVKVFSG